MNSEEANKPAELHLRWDHPDFPKSNVGWERIGNMLSKSISIKRLSISFDPNPYTRQRRTSLWKLAKGLKNNTSIEALHFSNVEFTVQGMFFLIMSTFWECNKNFRSLHLSSCRIQNMEMYALSRGLMVCKSLASLNISDTDLSGCRMPYLTFSISDNLQFIRFNSVNITKESLDALVMAVLATGSLPAVLDLSNNESIIEEDWESLRYLLQRQPVAMKRLVLSNNVISDSGIQLCIGPYIKDRQFPLLDLQLECVGLSDDGCIILADLLRCECCILEVLNLGRNVIFDTGAFILAAALKSNTTLRQLSFGQENYISSHGWNAFVTLLLNKRSIDETYRSNHTLCGIEKCGNQVHQYIVDYLQSYTEMNKTTLERGVKITAGYKILTYHLLNLYTKIGETSLEWLLAPDILGWIGQYNFWTDQCHYKTCLSAYYHTTKSNPLLFQNHATVSDNTNFLFVFEDETVPLSSILDDYISSTDMDDLMNMFMYQPIGSFDIGDKISTG